MAGVELVSGRGRGIGEGIVAGVELVRGDGGLELVRGRADRGGSRADEGEEEA